MNDVSFPEGDKSPGQLDPVIKQRIQEALERKRLEIEEYDEAIRECEENIAASPLPLKILSGLRLRTSPEETRKQRLITYKDSMERYSLPQIPEKVRRQIKLNRRSYQLYWLRKFLGDPTNGRTKIPFLDFPYDGGRDDREENKKVYNEDRTFCGPDDILKAVELSALEGDGRTIILYDTSDPSLQPRYEVVIDALTKLGFAIDESARRSEAAILADTSLDIHALDEFEGRALSRPGHRMLYEDWIHISDRDNTASGSFWIQGYENPEEHGGFGDFTEINPKLSELCKKWSIEHLTAGLTYERTPLDMKLSLQVDKNPKIIDVVENNSLGLIK